MKENKLWYTSPASDWNEALPLGNGKLGMMVFGGETEERIQLNEESFWSGWKFDEYDKPETYEHLDEIRQLIFAGNYTEAQRLCNQYLICRGGGASRRNVCVRLLSDGRRSLPDDSKRNSG